MLVSWLPTYFEQWDVDIASVDAFVIVPYVAQVRVLVSHRRVFQFVAAGRNRCWHWFSGRLFGVEARLVSAGSASLGTGVLNSAMYAFCYFYFAWLLKRVLACLARQRLFFGLPMACKVPQRAWSQ